MKVVIDTNVLKQIAQGNARLATALRKKLDDGQDIYIARFAYYELVLRAPTPELAAGYRSLLEEYVIKIAPSPTIDQTAAFARQNADHAMAIEADPRKKDTTPGALTYGDMMVAGEAKAMNASFLTTDEKARKRAANLGVAIDPDSRIKAIPKQDESIDVARTLLGKPRKPASEGVSPRAGTPQSEDVEERITTVPSLGISSEEETVSTSGTVRTTGEEEGTAGPAVKIARGTMAINIGVAAAGVGLQALNSYIDQQGTKDELSRIQNLLVPAEIQKRATEIRRMQLLGYGDIYANVSIRVSSTQITSRRPDIPQSSNSSAELVKVEISTQNINATTDSGPDASLGSLAAYTVIKQHTDTVYSIPVAIFTPEDLRLLADWSDRLRQVDRTLERKPHQADLWDERANLKAKIARKFGADVGVLQDTWMDI